MTDLFKVLIFLKIDRFSIVDLSFFFGCLWLGIKEEWWWLIPFGIAYFCLNIFLSAVCQSNIGKAILKEQTND